MKAYRNLGALLVIVITGLTALWWSAPSRRLAPSPARADAADAKPPAAEAKRAAGDDFGYAAAFDTELKKIGQISPQEFNRRYAAKAGYVHKLSWDPTTAKFWDEFNLDPSKVAAQRPAR